MANLSRYTLEYDENKKRWALENATGQAVKTFPTKEDATKRGVLKRAVGDEGGSVRIQKKSGSYQEERTFPRSRDPRRSKG